MEQKNLIKAKEWLNEEYDETTRQEVKQLIDTDEMQCVDAFYRDLEFGTGGMRGIMGVGTNRINKYTLAKATQGLANYMKSHFTTAPSIKMAIAYDNRNNSKLFSEIIANVLSGNGFKVYLFEDLRTTPELSFAIRFLKCHGGIVITASHNPKEYNGYKVYWDDGSQVISPMDKNIIQEVNKITSLKQVIFEGNKDNIHIIGREVDDAFFQAIKSLSIHPEKIKEQKDLGIVYTPLHGTGITAIPQCLKLFGFENVFLEPSQKISDGNFPTVVYPNPEEKEALKLAISIAEQKGADLVMATDPDSDRVGIAVKKIMSGGAGKSEFQLLNGNQTAALIIYYLLNSYKNKNKFGEGDFIVKTIVTTRLLNRIAENFNVSCYDVLTGFKYIAGIIREKEGKEKFIAGAEESYGYLIGDFVRDKDAVGACCIIAELAATLKSEGRSLLDLLKEICVNHGFFLESLVSITKKGKSGAEEIIAMMKQFRETPPSVIDGSKVVRFMDYKTSIVKNLLNGEETPTGLPASDVIQFLTEDDSLITARPSGTEPKIKFYFGVTAELKSTYLYEQTEKKLKEKLLRLEKDFRS